MRTLYLSAILFIGALLHTAYSYADDAIGAMADIVIGMQHFPSDADKASLATIAEGADSDAVKTVAHAIARISHKASDADKAKLGAVIAAGDTPPALAQLATVVRDFNHMPSADAVAVLQGLAHP